ncbi:MAG: hypothetical protein L3K25_07750 [Gammaproteobacteria bacterium]|nr:hypothetical protein [Gammaproteobacteria bacterium]
MKKLRTTVSVFIFTSLIMMSTTTAMAADVPSPHFLLSPSAAKEIGQAGCVYAGQFFGKGSVILMADEKRICLNNRISTTKYGNVYEWLAFRPSQNR